MEKDFQCVFSTCNKTKPIENKIPRDWEITKLKSLWQFFIARLLANLWMCVLPHLSALQVNSAWFLYLCQVKSLILGDCWGKVHAPLSLVQKSPVHSFSSSNYYMLCSCSFFSDHLSPKTYFFCSFLYLNSLAPPQTYKWYLIFTTMTVNQEKDLPQI